MARARNIKPGFFTNDRLAECAPLARLLFAGLWTIADRAGRLEDRPKRIKAELLPYDDCDADVMLNDLQAHGFIQRYEVNGAAFIQVLAFTKHQNPHIREPESIIPAPCEHSASTVPAEEKPEPARLIPDSPSLIPDSSKEGARAPKFTPPTLAEVSAYCAERANGVSPQKWLDHYTANGWRVGKNPMKDWRAAVRTWESPNGHAAKPGKFNPAAYSRGLAARTAAEGNGSPVSAHAGDVRTPLVIDVSGRHVRERVDGDVEQGVV